MSKYGGEKPFLYTFRKHKKKSIFVGVLGLWGLHYSVKQYRDYLRRREFCFEGKKYGESKINAITRPRRLLLFLNPEANDGKALKSYERNAAPILHLGGIEITTIKTDYEGQCKALTQYLDPNIDGIIVAGGDGTFLEVLTGLLRRKDQDVISKIPIGLIPLGRRNRSYKSIIGDSLDQNVTTIASSALYILKNTTKDVSVMEITTAKETRPTYAVDHIEWGPLKDAKENNRYWWTGPLKRRLPYVVATLKKWPPAVSATLFTKNEKKDIESKEECEYTLEKQGPVSFCGLFVKLLHDTKETIMKASIIPSDLNKLDFIRIGWRWENEENIFHANMKTTECREFQLDPVDVETSWYSIDGEKFDVRPVNVKILQNKIKVFCPSS